MFKGFDFKYPEYEVITPQTNASFTVRSLTVQEEERLKGSLLTPLKINEHLNKCIYEACVQKPEGINTFNTFLKNVTLKDRDALLYGIYHITYEDIRNYEVMCGACQKKYPVTIKASSTFDMNPYPNSDILSLEIPVKLPITNVVAYIKQPTLHDEDIILKSFGAMASSKMDVITETMIIAKFEYTPENGDSVIYSDREDIIDAYLSLPSRDKRVLYNTYHENFGKYCISMKMITNCIHCGHEETINIDLAENFFRMVHSVE